MARSTIPAGQWGQFTTRQLAPGKWRARTKVRDRSGQKHDISRMGTTRVKAEQALKAELLRVSMAHLSGRTTVADMAQVWLDQVLEDNTYSTNTKRSYRQSVTRHLIDGELGEVPLEDLTVAAVAAFLRKLARTNGAGAAKTARTCLLGVLDLAVHNQLIDLNVVRATPRSRAPRRPAPAEGERDTDRALEVPETAALLAYARADDYAVRFDLPDLLAFMLGTGARIGESCGVRWSWVDLEAGTARIGPKVVRVAGVGLEIEDEAKSEAGLRTLYLPASVVLMLSERRGRLNVGEAARRGLDVVFPSPLGKLRDPSNTAKSLRKVLDAAGFPWATSHTFRRTVATRMDEAGFTPREIANQLGHSRVSMSLDNYMDRRQPVTRAAEVL